jgi:undecaprenyl-diphosphatase
VNREGWLRVGAAGGVAAFVLLGLDQALHGPLYTLDSPADGWVTRIAAAHPWVHPVGQAMSFAGASFIDATALVLATLALLAWGQRRLAAMCLAAGALNGVLNFVLKQAFQRPLPPFIVDRYPHGFAFPSGHTMGATGTLGVAVLLLAEGRIRRKGLLPEAAHRLRVQAATLWLSVAAVVGAGRIVAQNHWLSDVLAAWALSLGLVCATLLLPWAKNPPRAHGASAGD